MLPVVPRREEFSLRLQPIDHRIGVFLDRRREDHQVEPLAHLLRRARETRNISITATAHMRNRSRQDSSKATTYPPQKIIAMRPLVHVVEYRVLRTDAGLSTHADVRRVQLYLDHVTRAHPAALGHAVD